MVGDLRDKMYCAISERGYISSWARDENGEYIRRKFSRHHIDAVLDAIMPVLEETIDESWRYKELCK